jgi:OOP family OmpA-OmpF porin
MAVAECDPVVKVEAKYVPPVIATQPSLLPSTPQPVPTPEITPSTETNLSDTAHFTFDESVLRPEDKATLDKLVQELKGSSYEVIYVTGHAGRIGTAEYNMELSTRRANVVQAYLVSKGIPADHIKTESKGETEPVTEDSDCRGMTRSNTIYCLRLDRRTEVTVVSTKKAPRN